MISDTCGCMLIRLQHATSKFPCAYGAACVNPNIIGTEVYRMLRSVYETQGLLDCATGEPCISSPLLARDNLAGSGFMQWDEHSAIPYVSDCNRILRICCQMPGAPETPKRGLCLL